jgi:hypothetical protein
MSSIQGLGFVLMVLGSFVYNRVLKLPECGQEEPRLPLLTEQIADENNGIDSANNDSEIPTLPETAS